MKEATLTCDFPKQIRKETRKEIQTAFKLASNSWVSQLEFTYLSIYSILHSVDVRDNLNDKRLVMSVLLLNIYFFPLYLKC